MLSDNFRRVDPYTPGAQPHFANMVKLNTNENPYPVSPLAAKAAAEIRSSELFRLYPPTDAGELKRALAEYHGVNDDQVFVGVGSDDVLAVIFQTCFASGEPVLFPDISYSFYDVWAKMFGVNHATVPLRENFTIDPSQYVQPNGGVVIANPNAPTGMVMPLSGIETILKANPERIVVVDEAYVDFCKETSLPLLDRYDNLIVVRTYSKSRSMAGMRIGYAIAKPNIINALESVKSAINSYTINWPSVVIGSAALKDEEYFRSTIDKIVATREWMTKELEKLGFRVLPSGANFVFASHEEVPAKVLFEKLEEKHIFVRYFPKKRIDNFLRITVGTDAQTQQLVDALTSIIQDYV